MCNSLSDTPLLLVYCLCALLCCRCVTHPLKEYMIAKMSENLRRQILIGVCLNVCMAAAGLVSTQVQAMHELRNLRRKSKGLPPLKAGEESEDDEIMEKSDYEHYKESHYLLGGREAQEVLKKGTAAAAAEITRDPKQESNNKPKGMLEGKQQEVLTDKEGVAV